MQTTRLLSARWARACSVRAHATVALTIAFALVAGLACDENAPTETRAPAGPTSIGAGSGQADLAAGNISTQAIALPVNQSVSTVAPNPAFRINQTGSGPDGIFQISNPSNTQAALQGLTNGRGRAGFFRIQNTANANSALEVTTNGTARAVTFQVTNASNNSGVLQASTNGAGPAVHGLATGRGQGGRFQIINTSNGEPALSALTTGLGVAFYAINTGTQGRAAQFEIDNASSPATAVGIRTFGTGLALDVSGPSTFNGNVTVNGTLTKTAGSFRIDHPLDPEHKYLSHSFVESPDMKNVYDGTVTLDASGRATVELPEYFEALNRDFRYQLTAIGAPGPNLYIAEGVKQNQFRIAGGRPYAHVSWMVTGIRKDAYAEEHRIRVEEDKPPAKPDLVAHR